MGLWSYCTARHGARHYGRENTFVAITILLLLSLLAPATSPALAADARGAAEAYRRDRSPRNLLAAAGASLAATVVLAGAVLVLIRFWRRLITVLERRYTRRLRSLEIQSVQVIHAERLREAVRTALRVVRALVILGLAYLYLSFVLTRFPWTRPAAARLLGYVLAPLATMAGGGLTALPKLVLLLILLLFTPSLLKIRGLLFTRLARGTVTFAGFERGGAAATSPL